jgi:translation initiation factor IF-2
MEKHVYLEKLGGDVPWAAISAKAGTGVEELLDLILLVAEIQEYKADAGGAATGFVIEAHRDQKRGIAATLIITGGSLSSGMAVLAGRAISPVRLMENHLGKNLKEATFSTPVQLIGFDELPDVGSEFKAFKSKKEAELARPAAAAAKPIQQGEQGEQFWLPVIVRADTTGSLEAIAHETVNIGDEHARVTIVQSGIGNITEGDLKSAMAGTTVGVIVGFNVGVDSIAQDYARQHGIRIEIFNIIYKMTERLQELLKEQAPKRRVEEVVGRAKILKKFSSRKTEHVVGGTVTEGTIGKSADMRVIRRSVNLGEATMINIQTNKQNVQRVDAGTEFGAQIEAEFEIAQGDILEAIVVKDA